MKSFFKNTILLASFSFISFSSFAHFGSKGPYGGGVSCSITFDSTVYIGTFEGGVFISTNSKAEAWRSRPVGLKSGKITALAHTGKYLFAATADSGVYRFTGFVGNDRYWEKVNTGLGSLKITSLVAIDSSTVMAGTDGMGIFKTTNKGTSWVAVNNAILHHEEITALAKARNRIIHTSKDGGVYASDDNGATWIALNDESTDDITATALSYNAKTDQLLVLNRDGLYVADSVSFDTTIDYSLAEVGIPIGAKVVSMSNDGDAWYLTTDKGLFFSTSFSIRWLSISSGTIQNPTILIPFRTNLILGTKNEGILRTNLLAMTPIVTWTAINTGFNNLATYAIATTGDKIIVTATEKGVFVSKDLATSYVRANKGLIDSLNVNDLLFADGYLMAVTKNAGFFLSSDTGKTWTQANIGLPSMIVNKIYYSRGKKYVFCSGQVFSSDLSSTSWLSEHYNLPTNSVPTSMNFFGDKMIISFFGNGVFLRSIYSTSWSAINIGLSDFGVTSSTYSLGKLFVGTAGSGVFVSDTASINWIPTSKLSITHTTMIGLDGSYVQAISSNLGYVYASYKGGLLASSDNGATWIPGGNQFNLPSYADVFNIAFTSGSAGRVFVTTPNNNIYSNSLSELPVISGLFDSYITKATNGIRVSPNPSNGAFVIQINEKVESVEVVNFAGQSVKQLPSISNQNVNLEVIKGIYLVRAKTVNGVLIQKVIVE